MSWGRAAALALAALGVLGAGQAPGTMVTVPVRILQLEQARSLGDGALAGFLNYPDPRIAARAALAIGRTKQPAGAVALVAHLGDRRPQVRAMSVYGLGLIAAGVAPERIIDAVRDRNSAVRAAALDAIGRYQTAGRFTPAEQGRAVRAVSGLLLNDRDARVRGRAAIALSWFAGSGQGDAASRALLCAAADRAARVRRLVMWSIFRGYAIRVPRAALVQRTKDPDEVVRIEAVRALGRVKNVDALPVLEPLRNDPSWRVQEQALESMRQLKGEPPTDHLKAIATGIHLPVIPPDPFAALPALARAPAPPSPGPGNPLRAMLQPMIDPISARAMDAPAPGPHPRVRLVTTKGNVYVELYPEWAPLTVESFLTAAQSGYYDNNRWFRIVPDFVVQTGDKNNNPDGDPGYTIGAEENPLQQHSYVISMGLNYDDHGAVRDSAGTQYYITLSPQYHLDQSFTVFGAVVSGSQVLAHLDESDSVLRIERVADLSAEHR